MDNDITSAHFSYQGFGIDQNGSIYISSGFGPNGDNVSKPHIYKIQDGTWYDADCTQMFTGSLANTFPEVEGLQVLDTNRVLVAVSYHANNVTNGSHAVVDHKLFRVSGDN